MSELEKEVELLHELRKEIEDTTSAINVAVSRLKQATYEPDALRLHLDNLTPASQPPPQPEP